MLGRTGMDQIHIALFTPGYPFVDAAIRALELSRRHGASFSRSIGEPLSLNRDQFARSFVATPSTHVLLLEGDSHVFRVDNPFSASSPLHGLHPSTPIADNVTRVVVEGSDAGRTEYLRLTIDSRKKKGPLFAWERVPLN